MNPILSAILMLLALALGYSLHSCECSISTNEIYDTLTYELNKLNGSLPYWTTADYLNIVQANPDKMKRRIQQARWEYQL